jgi:2-C-methyl-D-erythritol 4-phosphate cytidylyltransferase
VIVWSIVVAAGTGERFGDRKQYQPIGGRRMIDWSLAAASAASDGVVLVVPADRAADAETGANVVVAGGGSRSASVRAGLDAVPDRATHVVVHDAARPVPHPDVWQAVLDALASGAEAVVPVVPVTDTLREIDGKTVDRTRFVAVQTPQGFRSDVIRTAHAAGVEGTDDASLAEAIGATVTCVPGAASNIKVTTPADLILAEALCR